MLSPFGSPLGLQSEVIVLNRGGPLVPLCAWDVRASPKPWSMAIRRSSFSTRRLLALRWKVMVRGCFWARLAGGGSPAHPSPLCIRSAQTQAQGWGCTQLRVLAWHLRVLPSHGCWA